MHLEIVTPDKKIFEGEAISVKLPGTDGEFQLLDNHAALISSLGKGKLVIKTNENVEYVIDGGVAEVKNNKVIILAETLS